MTVKKYDPIHFFEDRGIHVGRYDQLVHDYQELQAKYNKIKTLYEASVRQRKALQSEESEKPTLH